MQIAKRFRSWAAWVSERDRGSFGLDQESKQLVSYLRRHAVLWEHYADVARTNPEKIPPPNKLTKGFKGSEFY